MSFPKKLVFIYTCIVVIPVMVIFFCISLASGERYSQEQKNAALRKVLDNSEQINRKIDSFARLESVVCADEEFMFALAKPETFSEEELVSALVEENVLLTRLTSVAPDIYALRIFADNPEVPERWPYILRSDRTELATLGRWEFNYSAGYMGNQGNLKLPSLCMTKPIVRKRRELGYIQIAVKMADFFPFLYRKDSSWQSDGIFILGGSSLVPVVAADSINVTEFSAAELDSLFAAVMEDTRTFVGMHEMNGKMMAWHRIPRMNMVVVHVNSTLLMHRRRILLAVVSLSGMLAAVVILFLVVRTTSARLMARVYSVLSGMIQVRNGNLSAVVEVNGSDEITETQLAFNQMVARIAGQIEQIKKEQQLVAETEIKAMQNQINAHFLYNVLETINMQAVLAGQDDISESITVLSRMMRYCLRWRNPCVSVSEELEYIRSYIYILNIRNDYSISLEIDIPPEAMEFSIPKMVLQPLVENAFFYAVEPAGADASIAVYAEDSGEKDRIYICVKDFGPGIPDEKLKLLNEYLAPDVPEHASDGGIGFKNIQTRLTTFYGISFRMKIESGVGRGTVVKIPVKRQRQEHKTDDYGHCC